MRLVQVMRRTLGVDAARQCALQADDEQLAAVAAAAAAYPETGDLNVLRDADLDFWTTIVVGSGNVAYRLALNTLVRSADDIGRDLFVAVNADMFIDRSAHLELAAAITARDADAAARLAGQSLSQLVDLLHT